MGDHLGAAREQRRSRRLLLAAGRRSEPADRARTRSSPVASMSGARWAFGAGRSGAQCPQDTTPNIAFYEANCPEFTVFGGQPGLRRLPAARRPAGLADSAGDLTGTSYGADRAGGSSLLARAEQGRPRNAVGDDFGRPRLRDAQRRCDRSGERHVAPDRQRDLADEVPELIYPDPDNVESRVGHVLGLQRGDADDAWSRLRRARERLGPWLGLVHEPQRRARHADIPDADSDGDLPVNDIVRDDAKHKLYVATDFGVLRGRQRRQGDWHVTEGLPRFEVMHLEIQPSARVPTCVGTSHCERVLYAATHSQGIWRLKLGGQGRRASKR